MPKGNAKDPWKNLPDDFRSAIQSSNEEDIRKRISLVALDQEELLEAKDNDEDLKSAMETAKAAGEVYREGTKANRLKIRFCKATLKSMGKL